MPAISVLMPVYNAAAYLKEATESILNQSFRDFEFLIFNDGSTDGSSEILHSYNDTRIRLFDFTDNRGYAVLLNIGLSESKGKFIARMDADDIAHPERFAKQYRFMEEHPEYVLCGSRYSIVDSRSPVILPLENDEIKLQMLYITPFCHPSVMMRRSILMDNKLQYNPEHSPAEDHELWVKLSDYGKFCNLGDVLLQYRIHDMNISLKERSKRQRQNLIDAQMSYILKFFKEASVGTLEATLLHELLFKQSNFDAGSLEKIGSLVQNIINKKCTYPVAAEKVTELLASKYFYACTTSTQLGTKAFRLANRFTFMNPTMMNNAKLLLKSVLKHKAAE